MYSYFPSHAFRLSSSINPGPILAASIAALTAAALLLVLALRALVKLAFAPARALAVVPGVPGTGRGVAAGVEVAEEMEAEGTTTSASCLRMNSLTTVVNSEV